MLHPTVGIGNRDAVIDVDLITAPRRRIYRGSRRRRDAGGCHQKQRARTKQAKWLSQESTYFRSSQATLVHRVPSSSCTSAKPSAAKLSSYNRDGADSAPRSC